MKQEEFSDKERVLFANAQKLSRDGDLHEVRKVMEELVKLNPNSPVFSAVLANTLWDIGYIDFATKEFIRAVELAPESEKISLGLFHCLWEQDKRDEALKEMKRFLSISDSDEYRELFKSIQAKSGIASASEDSDR